MSLKHPSYSGTATLGVAANSAFEIAYGGVTYLNAGSAAITMQGGSATASTIQAGNYVAQVKANNFGWEIGPFWSTDSVRLMDATTERVRFERNGDAKITGLLHLGSAYDTRFNRSATKQLRTECYESSLSAWQETQRSESSASGAMWSVFGATAVVQPVAITNTSGLTLANLELEVNKIKNAIRSLGLIAA